MTKVDVFYWEWYYCPKCMKTSSEVFYSDIREYDFGQHKCNNCGYAFGRFKSSSATIHIPIIGEVEENV